jgi:L-seryl-tRNA(Ser) seleniumtransferase
MIRQPASRIRERAENLLKRIRGLSAEIIEGESVIGGGSTPEQPVPTWLMAIEPRDPVAAEKRLRTRNPVVICRIEKDRLLFDLRTVLETEEEELAAALSELQA